MRDKCESQANVKFHVYSFVHMHENLAANKQPLSVRAVTFTAHASCEHAQDGSDRSCRLRRRRLFTHLPWALTVRRMVKNTRNDSLCWIKTVASGQ